MIIVIFSRPVFLSQLKLNNTDGVATIRRTPITIISIGKKNADKLGFLLGLTSLCYFFVCQRNNLECVLN